MVGLVSDRTNTFSYWLTFITIDRFLQYAAPSECYLNILREP
jgi:hypothetical protein